MKSTCYRARMAEERERRQYRKLTDDERATVLAAEQRRRDAVAEEENARIARNDLFRQLYAQGVSPTSMADAADLDRTGVQKICTPGQYRSRAER